jgi:uncharacterized protein YbjT (DUF2867 family)
LRRAALTGATGFLGLHVLPALARAGFQVRILARRAAAPAAWDGLSYETVHGDLSSPQALQALLQDADLVVHAAGLIKARRPADFYAVNRDGTAALAQAARRIAPQARSFRITPPASAKASRRHRRPLPTLPANYASCGRRRSTAPGIVKR